MRRLERMVSEYSNLLGVLSGKDRLRVVGSTVTQAPAIAKTRKLKALDAAMSRNTAVIFHEHVLNIPVQAIDRAVMAGTNDSYTFGTIREMLGNDVYLRAFQRDLHCSSVLDLGCNRGIFALIGRVVLGAETVIGVEPNEKYAAVHALLAQRNAVEPPKTYWKKVGSTSMEKADSAVVSIDTLIRENTLQTIDFVKIDIEGAEAQVFSEPGWLSITQNIAMELHPDVVDVSPVLEAVKKSGFRVLSMDQFGRPRNFKDAMFLYASRNGSLLN
jgi:SAM-dependent methyltransferase